MKEPGPRIGQGTSSMKNYHRVGTWIKARQGGKRSHGQRRRQVWGYRDYLGEQENWGSRVVQLGPE